MNATTAQKPIAKSLHTVTVLVQVAAGFIETGSTPDGALDAAMDILGLTGRDDPWNTRAAALKQLSPKAEA